MQVGDLITVGGVVREVIAPPDTYPLSGVDHHRLTLKAVRAMPGYWYAPLGTVVQVSRPGIDL